MLEQLGGRKFILTALGILLMAGLPLLYKSANISDSITQIVLAAIAGGIGTFGVTNALVTKWGQTDSDSPQPPAAPSSPLPETHKK